MFSTTVLKDDLDHNKQFLWTKSFENKVLSVKDKVKTNRDVATKIRFEGSLITYISAGAVQLPLSNKIYTLENITRASYDLLLPKNPKFLDWIVLSVLTDDVITSVDFDQFPLIRIKSKDNIMSHNEDLVCDVPFMSLRLTYTGVTDGWVLT